MISKASPPRTISVHVVEPGRAATQNWIRCELGEHLNFDAHDLASYLFADWEPILFDALLLAAAIEFCDRSLSRSKLRWGRELRLKIPVHDPQKWNGSVLESLQASVELLTGDRWEISVYQRRWQEPSPMQGHLALPAVVEAVIPYSNGLDSRAVSALMERVHGDRLVRVRLGTEVADKPDKPFKAVPYKLKSPNRFSESSARSRGFKFAMLSAVAAYMAKAATVLVPESGQGALGPALVVPGQGYEDYRNHPLFTVRMRAFIKALLNYDIRFEHPRLWYTKGETLTAYIEGLGSNPEWESTRSCWQDNRHASVDGKRRQCGICAACMLRRMSVHSAALKEKSDSYIWDDLTAPHFQASAAKGYKHSNSRAQREYAIAGALHMEHLAGIRQSRMIRPTIDLAIYQLSQALSMQEDVVRAQLDRLLSQHEKEWTDFMNALGARSFVAGFVGRTDG